MICSLLFISCSISLMMFYCSIIICSLRLDLSLNSCSFRISTYLTLPSVCSSFCFRTVISRCPVLIWSSFLLRSSSIRVTLLARARSSSTSLMRSFLIFSSWAPRCKESWSLNISSERATTNWFWFLSWIFNSATYFSLFYSSLCSLIVSWDFWAISLSFRANSLSK